MDDKEKIQSFGDMVDATEKLAKPWKMLCAWLVVALVVTLIATNAIWGYIHSQPMQGRTDYDIIRARKYILHLIKSKYWSNIVIVPSYKRHVSCETTPLFLLGNAIKALSKADIAIFLPGWEHYRGCKIEYICCKEYGIPTVELVGTRLRRC